MSISIQKLEYLVKREFVEKIMKKIAAEVTSATKDFIRKEWYNNSERYPESPYYKRMGDRGGFIATFKEGSEIANSLGYLSEIRNDRVYMRILIRDYSRLVSREGPIGGFGSHVSFDGTPLATSWADREDEEGVGPEARFKGHLGMDSLINSGWAIKSRSGAIIKRIKGLKFIDFAKDYLNKHYNEMLERYGAELGYTVTSGGQRREGPKRFSIDITKLEINIID